MEHIISKMSFAMLVMAMLCAGAAAQSSCTSVLVTLSPCLNYITGNSSTPSSGCCSQIRSVLSSKTQAQCLCQVLNGGGSSLGININQTQALALPSACNVKNSPSVSQCKATSPSPAKAPAGTATGTAAESPNSPTSDPSGSGSKSVPTTDGGSSSGNSVKLSIPLFITLALIYASAFGTY